MNIADHPYCNRAIHCIGMVGQATMALHGRGLFNMFCIYGAELQRDILELVEQGYMDTGLRPNSFEAMVHLPGFAPKNCRRMRYLWDYFTFLYMSHKAENILRRQIRDEDLDIPITLYLRGADYQLAIERKGAAVGQTTLDDTNFTWSILNKLETDRNFLKAFSPADLHMAMQNIGFYLSEKGNTLYNVAEFAREYRGGIFMNPATWKERLEALLPSASVYLVYVSNQSQGLMFELEKLLECGLEPHSILVLDEKRFDGRETFFDAQQRLREADEHIYLAVNRDACRVEDPATFEALLARFPYRIDLDSDRDTTREAIAALLPQVRRPKVAPLEEIPFEFSVNLDPSTQVEAQGLLNFVREAVERTVSGDRTDNWPVTLLYVELDIWLSLTLGDNLAAATASARYGAMADFTREAIERVERPDMVEFIEHLQVCGDVGLGVAYSAVAMGRWNDYSNRIASANAEVDATVQVMTSAMSRSFDQDVSIRLRAPKADVEHADPDSYVEAMKSMINALVTIEPPAEEADRPKSK